MMEWGSVNGLGRIRETGMFAIVKRHKSGATTAIIRYCEMGIELVLGVPALSTSGIRRITRTSVTFQDAPELRKLWSPAGWRMAEVDALLNEGLDTILAMQQAGMPIEQRTN